MLQKLQSEFIEKPKTKAGWIASFLGISTLFVWPLMILFLILVKPSIILMTGSVKFGLFSGIILVLLCFILTTTALVLDLKMYFKGEHSWLLVFGLVPSIFVFLVWLIMVF